MTSQSNRGDDHNIGDETLKTGFGDVAEKPQRASLYPRERPPFGGGLAMVGLFGNPPGEIESVHLELRPFYQEEHSASVSRGRHRDSLCSRRGEVGCQVTRFMFK